MATPASPVTLPPDSPLGSKLRCWLSNAALVIALWISLIRLPLSPTVELDPSWRMTLGYALAHGWQFGRDLVFTYGPLGFVLAPTNSGVLHVPQIAWQIGANLIFALAIWGLGRDFTGWRKAVYYVYFFAFGNSYVDVIHMIMILLFSLALLRDRFTANRWLTGLSALGLGILSLVKFTNLLLAGFAVACVLALHLWRRHRGTAGLVAGAFVLGFLGGWVALGQALGNLPTFVINSLSLSNGYVDAMGLEESGALLGMGLGAAAMIGCYYVLRILGAQDRPRTVAFTLIAAAASFLNWKHGFVRADGHVVAHFFVSLLLVSGYPFLLQDEPAFHRLKTACLAACAAFSLAGIWLISPPAIIWMPYTLNSRMVENAQMLGQVTAYPAKAREEFAHLSQIYSLNGIKALVRERSLDVLGNEQSYAIFNGFNYHARPTLQSYSAYNQHLEQLNADFYASPRAPDFILQKLNGATIDSHLPAIEDALAVRYLYHHYKFLMEERDFLVWVRQDPDPALDARTLLSRRQVKFDEPVVVPDLGETPVWCEFEVKPSLLGKLRTFLYKPPELHFVVTDGAGGDTNYRMVRERARAGFLAYPHFTSNYNVVKYQEGEPGPRISKLVALMPPGQRKYFSPDLEVRFYRLPPFPRVMRHVDKPPEIKFRVFNRIPLNATSAVPAEITMEDGKEVLFVHAPSSMEFDVVPTLHRVKGHFGFIAHAYQDGNNTDGSEFIIEWVDAGGKISPLFQRLLRPSTDPSDRGEQSFDIKLPPGHGRLLLRTTTGLHNSNAFDWTYWTDVVFSN